MVSPSGGDGDGIDYDDDDDDGRRTFAYSVWVCVNSSSSFACSVLSFFRGMNEFNVKNRTRIIQYLLHPLWCIHFFRWLFEEG